MAEKHFNVTVTTDKEMIRHNGIDYGKDDTFVATEAEAEALKDYVEIGKEAKQSAKTNDDKKSDSTKTDEDWSK